MKNDIRKKTCVIIRKNRLYLVGKVLWGDGLRWSCYRHEAWQTRNRALAEEIARRTGGITVLYNPITSDEKVM